MSKDSNFVNPPIVELVLGAQFSPLTKLSSGHFGVFWQALGEGWVDPADAPVLDEQFELFERPRRGGSPGLQLRIEPVRLPGRFQLRHASGDRLLQVQSTRFHLNWRRRGGFYPSYRILIAEFELALRRFETFVSDAGLGALAINQWEITYIDAFAKGEYWQTPADWPKVLPGLFGPLYEADDESLGLERRAAEWSYEIKPRRGRLHVVARPGQSVGDDRESLLLQMTARGPVGKSGVASLRDGLDLGHAVALKTFLGVTSDETKTRWEVSE